MVSFRQRTYPFVIRQVIIDLDTLQFVAVNLGQGKKDYTLHSDLADLKLTGKFQIETSSMI
jgi:hypothetical protein